MTTDDFPALNVNGLPISNPTCIHIWVMDPLRWLWLCVVCGYEITEKHRHESAAGHSPS